MKSINSARIAAFDHVTAKDDQVSLQYAVEGSLDGEPYKDHSAHTR